jgi:hypothetical protein
LIDKFLSCLSEQRLKDKGDFMAAPTNLAKHTAGGDRNAFHNAGQPVAPTIEREAT